MVEKIWIKIQVCLMYIYSFTKRSLSIVHILRLTLAVWNMALNKNRHRSLPQDLIIEVHNVDIIHDLVKSSFSGHEFLEYFKREWEERIGNRC